MHILDWMLYDLKVDFDAYIKTWILQLSRLNHP